MVDVNVDRSSISFIKVEIYGLNVNGCMAGYNDFLSASMTLNAANLTKISFPCKHSYTYFSYNGDSRCLNFDSLAIYDIYTLSGEKQTITYLCQV